MESALALYRESFPEVRIPDERVRALLDQGLYRLAVDVPDGEALCFALVAVFPKERFAHLDYVATDKRAQGQGLASKMLGFLIEELTRSGEPFRSGPSARPERSEGAEGGFDLLSLECQDHNLEYYRKRGALKLHGIRYIFPGGVSGPIPTSLLVFPLAGQSLLARDRVAAMVSALYAGVHGREACDPLLNTVIKSLPAEIALVSP